MAITQNTTYNQSEKQYPLANFSNISKLIQKKTAEPTQEEAPLRKFQPNDYGMMFGSGISSEPKQEDTWTPPIGTPIGKQEETKTQALPEGYNQFVSSYEGSPWSAPTEESVARNYPTSMGGGQYITDPSQKGALIKSSRAIMDANINPGAKQRLLGKLSPLDYQVDHIVPLWIGGADTLQNLQVYDNITHNKKTAVQSVALTLLAQNKIDLDEAKLMAFTWKDKDAKGLPSMDEIGELNGYVPLDVAEKYQQKWEKDLVKPKWGKYFGESFEEEMGNFGEGWMPDPLREFSKGLVGGGTAGIAPGTEASEDATTVDKVANFAGNLAGMITGFGLLSKGLAKVGAFGKTAKLASTPVFKYSGTGIKALDKVSKLGKTTIAAQEAARATRLAGITEKAIGKVSDISKWATTKTAMKTSALTLAVYGQLGLLGRELTGQEEFSLEKNISQAASDAIFGGLLGSAARFPRGGTGIAKSLPGYGYVGGATTIWSLIQGADIGDAVKDGIVMTALHGMGHQKKGTPDALREMLKPALYSEATQRANSLTKGLFPAVTKKSQIPKILEFDAPKIQEIDNFRLEYSGFKYPKKITNTNEALDFLENVARKESKVFEKNISEEKMMQELTGITTTFNEIRNQTLDPSIRAEKQIKDYYSISGKMRSQIKAKDIDGLMGTPSDALQTLPAEVISREAVPNDIQAKYADLKVEEGTSTTRGGGRDKKKQPLNPVARKNINDFATGAREHDGNLYIAQNDQTIKIARMKNLDSIESNQPIKIENPEYTLPTFMKDVKTGEKLETGYVPQPEGLRLTNKNNINRPLIDSVNELKAAFAAKDAEVLLAALNGHPAFKKAPIDLPRAKELLRMKNTVKDMTPTEFLEKIQAPDPMIEYNIDNSMIAPYMEKLKLPVLIVKVDKMSPIGKGTNPSDPSIQWNVKKNDYLRSLATQEKRIEKSTPMQEKLDKGIAEQRKKLVENKTGQIFNKEPIKVEKPVEIAPEVTESPVEAPKPQNETIALPKDLKPSFIEGLVKKGKIKAKEAEPYIAQEKRLEEITNEANERILENKERNEVTEITKSLRYFLQRKGVIKKTFIDYSKLKPELRTEETDVKNAENMSLDANNLFTTLKERIDDLKIIGYTSPKDQTTKLMNVIKSFKPKNTGLTGNYFKKILEQTKGRAKAYVDYMVDTTWKGQKYYLTETIYSRKQAESNILKRRLNKLTNQEKRFKAEQQEDIPTSDVEPLTQAEKLEIKELKGTKESEGIEKIEGKIEKLDKLEQKIIEKKRKKDLTKIEKEEIEKLQKEQEKLLIKYSGDSDLILADKYGLELELPNKFGKQFIKKEYGKPFFSEKFKAGNKTKKTPLEYWGSPLKKDFAALTAGRRSVANEFKKGLDSQKEAKNATDYSKGQAILLDKAMQVAYGETYDGVTYPWTKYGNANKAIKETMPEWMSITTPEGEGVTSTIGEITAKYKGKNLKERTNRLKKAWEANKEASEKNRLGTAERGNIEYEGLNENTKESQSREDMGVSISEILKLKQKNTNKTQDVLEDLTPYDKMMSGINLEEARIKVADNYNSLVNEVKRGTAWKSTPQTEGTLDLMKKEFTKIKDLVTKEESSKWKLGERIILPEYKPTAEQGMKDAFDMFLTMTKNVKPNREVDFEKLKKETLAEIKILQGKTKKEEAAWLSKQLKKGTYISK